MQAMAATGRLRDKPLYRYKFVSKEKLFEPVPEERAVISEIRELKAAAPQITISAICKVLTEAKFKPRKAAKWHDSTVKSIMRKNGIQCD